MFCRTSALKLNLLHGWSLALCLYSFSGFLNSDPSLEMVISLTVRLQLDQSGRMEYDEFTNLWRDLRLWKGIFKEHDYDRSGSFNAHELRMALEAAGEFFPLFSKDASHLKLREAVEILIPFFFTKKIFMHATSKCYTSSVIFLPNF